jgi:ketosteroid isomerase-like protein
LSFGLERERKMTAVTRAWELAQDWIEAWNKHDLDRIMNHYADEIVFWSPTIVARWGIPSGKLEGKEPLRQHFQRGLASPNLHFELITVLLGVDGYSMLYRRETGATVVEAVTENENGKAQYVRVYYGEKDASTGEK